jgi:hypothetical protein
VRKLDACGLLSDGSRRLKEVAEKSQSHSWPPMNTDERRLKTIALSAFISVDRRLNLPFPDFSAASERRRQPGLAAPLFDPVKPR